MDYYLDESGNTGDLSRTNAELTFGGQPVFSLAAIGIDDELKLTTELESLRKKHNVKAEELKLSQILKKKPKFALDAIELIAKNKHPFFIEIVDKKYQLAISITNALVMPSVFAPTQDEKSVYVMNVFADYIYHNFPDDIIFSFVQTMDGPSNERTDLLFDKLISYTKNLRDEVGKALVTMLIESKDDLKTASEMEGAIAYKHFLPIPDIGKRDQEVWILPNFGSFTNIYARINLQSKGKLDDSKFIHDTQAHFDEITEHAKSQMEGLNAERMGYHPPYSDYNLTENANLFFRKSHESTGVQLADIMAGLSMRWYLSHLDKERPDTFVLDESIRMLYNCSDARIGTGINLVAPHSKAIELFGADGY